MRFSFSSNNTPWAPDSRAKAFFNSAPNSPKYDRFSNAKIVHAVSLTLKMFCYVAPLNLYVFRGDVGQEHTVYVFDRYSLGCQGRSNRSSIVHVVPYFACTMHF
jgi:hypothetical protein